MVIFHAGTMFNPDDGQLMTSGGRVLCAVGIADSVVHAQKKAYEAVAEITFENAQYRKDIADKALR